MSWIGLHKSADVIFGITQKPFHIESDEGIQRNFSGLVL